MTTPSNGSEDRAENEAQTEAMAVEPRKCDLLVRNAHVITMDDERRVISRGAIAIGGTRIESVGVEEEVLASWVSDRTLDARGAVVHPGFVEAHIHISQHSSRGALCVFNAPGAVVRYAEWKANLQEHDEFASTALACVELLRGGYTAFVDPGTVFVPDAAAAAAASVGMRGWLADPYLWDRGETLELYPSLISSDLRRRVPCDLERCQRELGGQLARNMDADALVKGHVALYGESTASDELQRSAKDRAAQAGVTFTQHVGFAVEISEAEEARLGKTQVLHMAELGLLDERTTFVHMNVITDDDVGPVTASRMSIIWCPANYLCVAAPGGARTRIPELHRQGTNVALGIDTPGNCTVGDNAAIAYIAAREAGTHVSQHELLEMQTIGAARSIGAANEIGSLQTGKRADLVIRSPDALELIGFDAAFELCMFARSQTVDTVIVNGEVVLRGGRSTRVDERAVLERAKVSMKSIAARIGLTPSSAWPTLT
ncbi:MAG: amidohydrolase family protein [Gammaproteobacteria bacterium]